MVPGVPAGASMQETFCLPHYVYASLPQTFDAQLGTRHSRFGYRPYRIVDYRK